MPIKVRKKIVFKTNHSFGVGSHCPGTKKERKKISNLKYHGKPENKLKRNIGNKIKRQLKRKVNEEISKTSLNNEICNNGHLTNKIVEAQANKIERLENIIHYYEQIEFNNTLDTDECNEDDDYDGSGKFGYQYSYDDASYYLQLSLITPTNNIAKFIYINEKRSNKNLTLENVKLKIPSENQISRWRQQRLQYYNYVYLAYCFSGIGHFGLSNNTLCRDGSSIDGKIIEAIVAVTSNNDNNDDDKLIYTILGIPNIKSKHALSISDSIVHVATEIDIAQKGLLYYISLYDHILRLSYEKTELQIQSSNNHTILNQLNLHLHDKAANENKATELLQQHQTTNIENLDFNCQTHALNHCFNGIVKGIKGFMEIYANNNNINKYNLKCYNEGLLGVAKILCKLFSKSTNYLYNQVQSLEGFEILHNNESYQKSSYIYSKLPSFPYTREFHFMGFVHTIICGFPILEQWYKIHEVCTPCMLHILL